VGSYSYAGEGIRIESDAGSGWTVVNNISMRHGISQRCYMNVRFKFANASAIFDIDDFALLGNTPSDPRTRYGIYGTGIIDNLSLRNFKQESVPYSIAINNSASRYDVQIQNISLSNCEHMFNFIGTSGDVSLLGKNAFKCTSAGTYNVWEQIDADVDVHDSTFITSSVGSVSLAGNISGSGRIVNHFDTISTKSGTTTINLAQENRTNTNEGALVATTFNLPTPSADGFRAHFSVLAAQALRIEPGAAQIIGLTDVAGDRISSSTIGDTVSLKYIGGDWYVQALYGTWADIN